MLAAIKLSGSSLCNVTTETSVNYKQFLRGMTTDAFWSEKHTLESQPSESFPIYSIQALPSQAAQKSRGIRV